MLQKGKKPLPDDETDTVADIFRRMDDRTDEQLVQFAGWRPTFEKA